MLEERPPLGIVGRRGADRDVEPRDPLHFVVVHLGEDDLLANPQRQIPPAVEALGRHPLECAVRRRGEAGLGAGREVRLEGDRSLGWIG